MSELQRIEDWLAAKKPDYTTGVDLLRPHLANKTLLNVLSKKENEYNRQKTRYELEKVAGKLRLQQPATPPEAAAVTPEPVPPPSGEQPPPGGLVEHRVLLPPDGQPGVVQIENGSGLSLDPNAPDQARANTPPDGEDFDFTATSANRNNAPTPDELLQMRPADQMPAEPPPGTAPLPINILGYPGVAANLFIYQDAAQVLQEANKLLQEAANPLDKLNEVLNALYIRKGRLSNSLREKTTDEDRKAVIDELDQVEQMYNKFLTDKEYFEQHGKLPDLAPPPPEADEDAPSRAQLEQWLDNARSRRSKAQKAVNEDPGNVKKQERLAKEQASVAELELQLKTPTNAS